MKAQYIILVLLASSTFLFASLDTLFDKSKSPEISLPDAYRQALIALESNTNQYYCISATIRDVTPQVWLFTFCSTNTPPKKMLVYVEMNIKHEFYIAK
jgi:hypothetical protein